MLTSPNFNSSSVQGNSSEFSSINSGDFYDNSLNQVDVLQVADGKVIKIEFTAFDIENNGERCPWDHLSIVEKDGTVLLDKACGIRGPFTICSQTNEVYFTFITDCIIGRPGWSAEWSAVSETDC